MQFRENISLDGIPIVWKTNLSDQDVKDFFAEHGLEAPWQCCNISIFDRKITIKFLIATVPFRDGACLWSAFNDRHSVTFRTNQDWELWRARKLEIDELRDEQNHERAAEDQLFRTEDAHLLANARDAVREGNFATAADHYYARAHLCRTVQRLPPSHCLYFVVDDAIRQFSNFPDASYGLSFLKEFSDSPPQYHAFAGYFRHWHRSLGLAHRHAQAEKICDTAITRFPTDGQLFKDMCLAWRREQRLDLAIKYCRAAISAGVSDDTKSGFAGRLKRLCSEHDHAHRK